MFLISILKASCYSDGPILWVRWCMPVASAVQEAGESWAQERVQGQPGRQRDNASSTKIYKRTMHQSRESYPLRMPEPWACCTAGSCVRRRLHILPHKKGSVGRDWKCHPSLRVCWGRGVAADKLRCSVINPHPSKQLNSGGHTWKENMKKSDITEENGGEDKLKFHIHRRNCQRTKISLKEMKETEVSSPMQL